MALTPKTPTEADDKKAAVAAAQDEALLREVDDAVRQDELADFGRKYGRPILGTVIAGLAVFGGYLWWDGTREAAMEADSEKLVSAMDQIDAGNPKSAEETLKGLTGSDHAGTRAAAMILQGATLAQQGDLAGAGKRFGEIAADSSAPQAYRDLAMVRQVEALYDTMKPEDVVTRLKPLAVSGNPFFGRAGELLAMAYLDQGKRREAGTLFSQISRDKDVPETLRSRARQMAGLLGVDAIEDVDKVLKEVNADTGAASATGGIATSGG